MDTLVNLSPMALGGLIFGAVLLMALLRNIEARSINKRFNPEELLLVSFGVTYYGRESAIKKPKHISGAIALVKDGVFFRSRFGKTEVFLLLKDIKMIGTTDFFCDKPLNQTVIQVSFTNDSGELDRTAFRIPSPAKWVYTLKKQIMISSKS